MWSNKWSSILYTSKKHPLKTDQILTNSWSNNKPKILVAKIVAEQIVTENRTKISKKLMESERELKSKIKKRKTIQIQHKILPKITQILTNIPLRIGQILAKYPPKIFSILTWPRAIISQKRAEKLASETTKNWLQSDQNIQPKITKTEK